jgi:ArsR family transcriptional regulator
MTPSPIPLDRSLQAIADPTRRRILALLRRRGADSSSSASPPGKHGGLCAGDIAERVGLSQPTVSHHMAILTAAGLVHTVKQGQWRWYSRNEKALRHLVKGLRAQL